MGRSDPVVEGCASGGRLLGTGAAPASEAGAPLHDHHAIAITALRTQRTHQIEARLADRNIRSQQTFSARKIAIVAAAPGSITDH